LLLVGLVARTAGTRCHHTAHFGTAGTPRSELYVPVGGISAVAETLILLHYVELRSKLFQLISLFKVREGAFDPANRQFVITDNGIVVGEPSESVEAILSGMPRWAARTDALPSSEDGKGQTPEGTRSCGMNNSLTVLIVEDEFAIADLLEMALTDEGCRVV
jgi:hypothetical protein